MTVAKTLHERILAHLREHPFNPQGPAAPRAVTQDGIANATGARVAHVSRGLGVLSARGLVEFQMGRVAGAMRKSRVHWLTETGREAARGLVLPPPEAPDSSDSRPALPLHPHALGELSSALDEALAGGHRIVLVEGDAGIGKSRLLADFEATLALRRVRCAAGRATPLGAEQALGPLQQALAPLGLARRYAEAPLGTPLERAREAAVRTLAAAAPVALLLDDLHLAGPSAIEFLHGVLKSLPQGAKVFLVAAFRRDEAWGLPNGPLYTALMPLAAHPRGRIVTLAPLDQHAIGRLLEAHGHNLDADLLGRVTRESGGNPSYALAMAELFEDGVDESDFFPPLARAYVRERFAGLPPDALVLLQCAAVCGVEFDLDHLARAYGASVEAIAPSVDLLLDRLLLEETLAPEGPRLRFDHPKVREAALAEMTATRQRVVAGRLASLFAPS